MEPMKLEKNRKLVPWRTRNSSTSTAVGSECHRLAGFLGKEDRAYVSAAPRATLA